MKIDNVIDAADKAKKLLFWNMPWGHATCRRNRKNGFRHCAKQVITVNQ